MSVTTSLNLLNICFRNTRIRRMVLMQVRNSEFGVRMRAHPKSSSDAKNDWLVVAMHATEGSRSAERCYRKCGIRSSEFGMKNIAS